MSSLYDPGGLKLPSCSASPGYPGIDLHTVSTSEAETVESTDELPSEAKGWDGNLFGSFDLRVHDWWVQESKVSPGVLFKKVTVIWHPFFRQVHDGDPNVL